MWTCCYSVHVYIYALVCTYVHACVQCTTVNVPHWNPIVFQAHSCMQTTDLKWIYMCSVVRAFDCNSKDLVLNSSFKQPYACVHTWAVNTPQSYPFVCVGWSFETMWIIWWYEVYCWDFAYCSVNVFPLWPVCLKISWLASSI